jgi:hypothetical protein
LATPAYTRFAKRMKIKLKGEVINMTAALNPICWNSAFSKACPTNDQESKR